LNPAGSVPPNARTDCAMLASRARCALAVVLLRAAAVAQDYIFHPPVLLFLLLLLLPSSLGLRLDTRSVFCLPDDLILDRKPLFRAVEGRSRCFYGATDFFHLPPFYPFRSSPPAGLGSNGVLSPPLTATLKIPCAPHQSPDYHMHPAFQGILPPQRRRLFLPVALNKVLNFSVPLFHGAEDPGEVVRNVCSVRVVAVAMCSYNDPLRCSVPHVSFRTQIFSGPSSPVPCVLWD